jgi:6-pyruvoyltetrahydropterin/6-carboxytetrahydropterin synthase
MFILRKRVTFEAAHHLPSHDGKCARVHGHSWVAVIEVQGSDLYDDGPKVGMLTDYADIARAINGLVEDYLDHFDLNVSTGLENPTSEELARWVFDRLHLEGLSAVTIHETCTSECRYEGH